MKRKLKKEETLTIAVLDDTNTYLVLFKDLHTLKIELGITILII
jgi:hypothetical protein